VVPNFVVQWGMHGDPEVMKKWIDATIADDPVVETNGRGTVTFAKTNSPNSRSVQLFVNLRDNPRLDGMGFAPIGRVVEGMEAVEAINPEYGEAPNQGKIFESGNEYLQKQFPNLTYIQRARVAD
ncbi:MAG: peptidylprolyl isomerase, partial [Gemmatimonadota bacterium]